MADRRTTLTIDGNEQGAVRSLDRVARTADQMGDEIQQSARAATRSTDRLFASMARGATITTGVAAGLGILRGAFNAVRGSAEMFFQSTEAGREEFVAIQEQMRAVQGTLFELVIGTDDAGEAADRLGEILSAVTAIVDGLGVVLGPVITTIRTVFVGGLNAAADVLAVVTGNADRFNEELVELETEALDAADAVSELTRRQNELADALGRQRAVTPEGQLDTARRELREYQEQLVSSRIAEELGGVAEDYQAEIDRLTQASLDGVDAVATFIDENGRALSIGVGDVSDNVGVRLGSFGDIVEDVGRRTGNSADGINVVSERMAELSIALATAEDNLEPIAPILAEIEEEARNSGSAISALAAELLKLDAGAGKVVDIGKATIAVLDELAAKDAKEAFLPRATEGAFTLAGELQFVAEALENVAKTLDALGAVGPKAVDDLTKVGVAAQQLGALAEVGFGAFAGASVDAFGAVAEASGAADDVAREAIASTLRAVAQAAVAKAGIVAFDPLQGGPPAAAGLIAGAIAATIAAGQISPGDSGGGAGGGPIAAGTASAAGPVATSQTNVNFVSNFGGALTNRREAAAGVADAVMNAQRMGYLPRAN